MIKAAVRLWGEMAPERRKEALTQGSFAWAESKKKKKKNHQRECVPSRGRTCITHVQSKGLIRATVRGATRLTQERINCQQEAQNMRDEARSILVKMLYP